MAGAVVAIWVRKPVPWDDEGAFRAQIPDAFRRKVDVWNGTFTMPYHVFRGEVRRIAELNQDAVRGAARLDWEEIPDGALVLPVDDDDWFAPDIGEAWRGTAIRTPPRTGGRAASSRCRSGSATSSTSSAAGSSRRAATLELHDEQLRPRQAGRRPRAGGGATCVRARGSTARCRAVSPGFQHG
jgi:hypothetical protein